MDIPEIRTDNININSIDIPDMPDWVTSSPQAIPIYPPVTTQVGIPIIDMPGCVEAHESDDGKNKNLVDNDPKGVKVYCDSGMPSFNPMDYNKDDLTFTGPPVKPPKIKSPDPPAAPETQVPKTEGPPVSTANTKEPEKVCEWYKELLASDPRCIEPTFAETYLPPVGMVTTTATIAAVATTSAIFAKPIADLLMKVVKPVVKKVIKKGKEKLGKQVKAESVYERRKWQRDLRKK